MHEIVVLLGYGCLGSEGKRGREALRLSGGGGDGLIRGLCGLPVGYFCEPRFVAMFCFPRSNVHLISPVAKS